MNDRTFFLKTYAAEFATTQNVLKAVPEDKGDYTPNPVSKTLRQLAWSVAASELAWQQIAGKGIDFADAAWKREAPATLAEMIAVHAADHAASMAALEALDDAAWEAEIPGWMGGPMPRYELAWGMLHDTIHHRGQLTTYLRAVGAIVPSIYGPTAEQPMQMDA